MQRHLTLKMQKKLQKSFSSPKLTKSLKEDDQHLFWTEPELTDEALQFITEFKLGKISLLHWPEDVRETLWKAFSKDFQPHGSKSQTV
jgi:hypothetical protein